MTIRLHSKPSTLHSKPSTLHCALCTFLLLLLTGCTPISSYLNHQGKEKVEIRRFDRLEYRYITTGDFLSLQQMCTDYPTEMRTLIEEVLKIGQVDKEDVKSKLLTFFQDSTLIAIARDTEEIYANTDFLNDQLNEAFSSLIEQIPQAEIPSIYTQIGSLDQSIIIKDGSIGISLDKYLGSDYPIYRKYYDERQRATMTTERIVPDCIVFYLISLYPLENFSTTSQAEKDDYIGRLFWIANQILDRRAFDEAPLHKIEETVLKQHPDITIDEMLLSLRK